MAYQNTMHSIAQALSFVFDYCGYKEDLTYKIDIGGEIYIHFVQVENAVK